MSFNLVTPLIDLFKNIAKDDEIVIELKCGRTKAVETANNILSKSSLEDFCEQLRRKKFSIIIDETTDISTSKVLAVVVRYFDDKLGKVCDRLLNLIELDNSDSKSIYSSIIDFMEKAKIPISNMIGFAADNAASMMGSLNGVQALFRHVNKNLYVVGCVCHSLNLCSSAASKAIPSAVEHLVRDIYSFFSHSSKRQNQFREFQEYFDVKQHKILKIANTRWLSLEAAVQRILEQWQPLKHFFLYNEFDQNNDVASKILQGMTSENLCYLQFLSYSLNAVNKLNLEFQAERPRFHKILESFKFYFKNLANNFLHLNLMDMEEINNINFDDTSIFKPTTDVYIGPRAEMTIKDQGLTSEQLYEIKKKL